MSTAKKQLVYIKWMDSSSVSRDNGIWVDQASVTESEPCAVESVGWIVKETEDTLIIVSHMAPIQYSGDMTIPKVCIVERKNLRVR